MDWIQKLLTDPSSIAHIVVLYSFVIALGIYLGKIKIFGVSLGVTFVLFAGIVAGHIAHVSGIVENPEVVHFIQEFGLILFVFCIGLQVGPGFFSSFKEGGVKMNIIAVGIILLNIATMLTLYYTCFDTSDPKNLPMMVGVLCGAITNTPGLGAADGAVKSIFGANAPDIASGYACAYPLGVVGIIAATIAIRYICRVSMKAEEDEINQAEGSDPHMKPHLMHVQLNNSALEGKTFSELRSFLGRDFVCSRILHDGHVSIPNAQTTICVGDQMFIVCAEEDADAVVAFMGEEVNVDWESQDTPLESRRVVITNEKINGKTLGKIKLNSMYGVNVTRITRSGMDLFARPNLVLQMGDRLMIVGPSDAVERASTLLGNAVKRLNHPNIATIFVGIMVGIIFGSIPIAIPGMPTPLKLGLAGGPLIIAILLGAYGYKFRLVTYTTTSANLMLRETGLALFLASVGIKAGASFVDTVVAGDGLKYVGCGFLITVIPILIMGIVGRLKFKLNYFTLMGLIAGSNTDPPALAYANQTAGNGAPAIGYSTVYPLSMFLRILTAQLIILTLCAVA
ncbi:MAG: putative transporter [Bacteroidaceae bacterium]|nr:putative transporter [Bacteroidaceae bacterium]